MDDYLIYHNPRCRKSRAALEILREHGIEPQIIEYLNNPLDAPALRDLLEKLGAGVRDILREGEAEFQKLDLAGPPMSDDDLIAAIVRHPILLQRPIVVRGNRAVIGRPPEKVKELL